MTASSRGVSAPLGVALMLTVITAGMVLTVTVGTVALDDTRENLGSSRAEKSLTQFDSQVAMVALGSTRTQNIQLSASGDASYQVREDAGWMNVTITNTTSGDTKQLMNQTLGKIVYDTGEKSVAYQGGGVWRKQGNGSAMVSPPEFHFRNATLTLPLVVVDGDESVGTRARVRRNGSTVQKYPNATLDKNWTNPLENGKVRITVHSDYYQAWGQYFEQRTEGVVDYDHDAETASITLKVPAGKRTVSSAVASTAEGGTLTISGSGSDVARTDSYTSADGDGYSTSENTNDGNITVAGDIELTGNACVIGSVKSGSSVSESGNANKCPTSGQKVSGDVFWTTSENVDASAVGGDIERIEGVEGDSNINSHIDENVDEIESDPDSDSDISGGDTLQFGPDQTAELEAGQYYLDALEIGPSETLTLDTTDGDIAIAVENYVKLTGSASLEVQGDNQVKIYVKGENEDAKGYDVRMVNDMGDSPAVNVPGENASQLWLYGKSNMEARFKGSSSDVVFDGVIYAPGGTGGSGNVYIEKTQIYGGVVSPDLEIKQGGEFHYDRALNTRVAVPKNSKVVSITYLHISVNRVNVTAG